MARGHTCPGACVAGGVCMAGGMHGRVVCMAEGVHGRRDGHCSGRYASYWNAFLFLFVLEHSVFC